MLQKKDKFCHHEVINKVTIDNLISYGDVEMVKEAMEEFVIATTGQLKDCDNAFIKRDYTGIRDHMHAIKGNASTLGIDRVAAYALSIEENLKANKIKGLKSDLTALKLLFKEFNNLYQPIINEYDGK